MIRAVIAVAAVALSGPAAGEPLGFYNGRLFIDAQVNGVPTEALLDSGAEATLVDRDVLAAIDDQPSHNDLNVGTSVLKDFLITTDFNQHAVWLQPVGGSN